MPTDPLLVARLEQQLTFARDRVAALERALEAARAGRPASDGAIAPVEAETVRAASATVRVLHYMTSLSQPTTSNLIGRAVGAGDQHVRVVLSRTAGLGLVVSPARGSWAITDRGRAWVEFQLGRARGLGPGRAAVGTMFARAPVAKTSCPRCGRTVDATRCWCGRRPHKVAVGSLRTVDHAFLPYGCLCYPIDWPPAMKLQLLELRSFPTRPQPDRVDVDTLTPDQARVLEAFSAAEPSAHSRRAPGHFRRTQLKVTPESLGLIEHPPEASGPVAEPAAEPPVEHREEEKAAVPAPQVASVESSPGAVVAAPPPPTALTAPSFDYVAHVEAAVRAPQPPPSPPVLDPLGGGVAAPGGVAPPVVGVPLPPPAAVAPPPPPPPSSSSSCGRNFPPEDNQF